MSEARIDVVIGSAQAQSGANAVQRAVDQIKNNFLDLSAKVFVAEQAVERMWSQASKGAQFEETISRLNRQMSGFNSTGQLMVSTLTSITQGTLGVDRAATMASRALSVGLNPDQVKTFTEAAMLLKNVMGTELPQAFDEIVNAAISGRAAVLGNIGVYVDLDEEIKKLAVSTNRTTDQITKQEKAMLTAKAVTAQIGDATHRLSDGMLSDADRLKQVEARWDNLWTTIGQGAKTAVIGTLDWLGKLSKGIEDSVSKEMAGRIAMQNAQPGNPNNPITQQIFGQAIVQDSLGNQARTRDQFTRAASSKVLTQLPTALQGSQLDAQRERQDKALTDDFDRTKADLAARSRLYDIDAQRQLMTQEDLTASKNMLRLQEVASEGQTLNQEKALEDQFHAKRVQIGFQSTEERISEDERYRSKVFDINQALLTNAKTMGEASAQATAESDAARDAAETRRGGRLTEQFKSEFDIKEALRRQDLDDAQTYFQGEFDMATARFASDTEIAGKERELLREQLAFKLRLTQDEVDQVLALRKAGDFEGMRQITSRADPALNPRAVEGIVESASAKDMMAAERANGDFFAGWSRGLQKYSQDRDTAFGMSTDMARRAAQGMEQGFQTLFFDSMSGKFQSFKDVLQGVLTFTEQIISQIAAQMVTVGIIKPGAGALSGMLGSLSESTALAGSRNVSGVNVRGLTFAEGGMGDFGSGTVATLHGKEAIVPLSGGRSIPVTLRYADAVPSGSGGGPTIMNSVKVEILNQMPKTADVQVRQGGKGPDGSQLIKIVIGEVKKAYAEGRFDQINRSRYGLIPGER